MRKIKLQMTTSLDGFVKSKQGDSVWDQEVTDFCIKNLEDVDAILLGRNTVTEFIPYWKDVAAKTDDEFNTLGRLLTDMPKIAFSNTLQASKWDNASTLSGELKSEVEELKSKEGKNIMVYGGVSFVSSLIQFDLVDEFHLLIYPFAAGSGDQVFNRIHSNLLLTLKTSRQFPCGIILAHYERRK